MPNGPLPEAKPTEPESAHLPTMSLTFRSVMNEIPYRNDSSSMFDRSFPSSTSSQSESELRMISSTRGRKIHDQDACEGDCLNGRQKKHSLRQSLLQEALKSTKKTIRDRRPDLENEHDNEVGSFPPNDKIPLGQAPGRPRGSVTFDDYMQWQSHAALESDSGDEKGVEMQHTSMAVNCSK